MTINIVKNVIYVADPLLTCYSVLMGNPVRKIPHRTRGVRGYFFSLKNGRRVDYESLNEQCLMKVLETDPFVDSYCEQPVQLEYEWNGVLRTYTPDVLSTDIYSKSILYEVKPEKDLEKDDGRLVAKFERAREYGLERGWDFKVVTEVIRKSPEYRRADLLWPHLMDTSIEEPMIDLVLSKLRESGHMKISDLANKQTWADPSYCAVLHLIGRGEIIESSYGNFGPDTEVKVFARHGE